jgi:hypothetical protein
MTPTVKPHFACPDEIQDVAWEGNLVAAPNFMMGGSGPDAGAEPPGVRLGRPERWPLAGAPERSPGGPWVPPPGVPDSKEFNYWLLRLACDLRPPGKAKILKEANFTLSLRPADEETAAPAGGKGAEPSVYAYDLHPDRRDTEDHKVLNFRLGFWTTMLPDGSVWRGGNVEAGWDYRRVFPVIESHGVGTSTPYWIFRHHATVHLVGSQLVYAVVAASHKVKAFWAALDLTATVQDTGWAGWIRYILPSRESRDSLGFLIPNQVS